jgi:hypothetical protein
VLTRGQRKTILFVYMVSGGSQHSMLTLHTEPADTTQSLHTGSLCTLNRLSWGGLDRLVSSQNARENKILTCHIECVQKNVERCFRILLKKQITEPVRKL